MEAMTTLQSPPASPAPASPTPSSWLSGRPGLVLVWLAVASCAAGLLAGVVAGPLWLDEALSVEIARRPLPELFEALRRDGSPPLYYLLLHGWIAAFGTGTVVVRLLTVLMVPLALLLVHRLGGQVGGPAGARAAVVVLAALPWTMRYGSETRMYLLVVVLVLAGALALLRVRSGPSRGAVVALAACVGALLLTHYWALFLLAAVGLLHLPGLLRRDAAAVRVTAAFTLGGVLFSPWLPSFLFQVANTGAPWAVPPGVVALLRTPTLWGGGPLAVRVVIGVLVVALMAVAVVRAPRSRVLVGVAGLTLLLAWAQTAVMGGAYTGRYTAVVVPLVAVAAGLGAVALPVTRWQALALGALVLVGGVSGVQAATVARTPAGGIADAFTAAARPGDVLLFCPDQLGPAVARELGSGYEQVVYPTLGRPEVIDWVGYEARNETASPAAVAARVHELAGQRQLFVLKATGYRTLGLPDRRFRPGDRDDCDALLSSVADLRGPSEHLYGELDTAKQQLFRFDGG
jgi:mannosyltransferase